MSQQSNLHNKYNLFCDVETSGKDWLTNDVISWSGLVTDKKLNVLDKKTILMRPDSEASWDEETEEIHGYSYYEAACFPTRREGIIGILNFLAQFRHPHNSPLLFIDHSLFRFDLLFTIGSFMKEDAHFSLYKVIQNSPGCYEGTIQMSRKAGYGQKILTDEKGRTVLTEKGKPKKEGNGLKVWAKRLNMKLDHHNSEADTQMCYEVYKFLSRGMN